MTLLALSRHAPDAVLAHTPAGPVTAGRFFADVVRLAAALPPGQYVVNTCEDRYLFMLGLGAALLRQRPTLMPPGFTPEWLHRIQSGYPGALCLHDGRQQPHGLPGLQLAHDAQGGGFAPQAPLIDAAQMAAIVFTSGTTGEPGEHHKRWGQLCADALSESERLDCQGMHIVATVPSQHMYGLESSILLALQGGARLWSGRPFYPCDIAATLAATPRPRMLVSTPFHLGALLDSGVPLPACDLALCATAPLPADLALRAEAALACPLIEIYGSTESGQVASRRTTQTQLWHLLPGVQMEADPDGVWVHGGHVPARLRLSDHIELLDAAHFRLGPRHADMVNVAGKRASLAALTAQLLAIDGVADGCFFCPPDNGTQGVQRLAALVVAAQADLPRIRAALRQRIEPAFMPRPLLRVPALPRNDTGKVLARSVLAIYQAHQSS